VGPHYSSGGYWRLAQPLTAVRTKDLKQVLDERLFSDMDIPTDRWDWTPGQIVHDTEDWYPRTPGYGLFLDPPYRISGYVVRGGLGWVVMSPRDLARFGLLVATGGMWKGKRLISSVRGHNGGNGSNVGGIGGRVMGSWGKLTCTYDHGKITWRLFTGPPAREMGRHR
jgi:CubicO group peptidase (beta-lactamase class C family)